MSKCLHPSIMPLVHHEQVPDGADGGTVYMLMPLFLTGSLWDLVEWRRAEQKPLSNTEIVSIVEQVCRKAACATCVQHAYADDV